MKKIFYLIVIFIISIQTSCAKEIDSLLLLTDEPDTILHSDSKYIAVFGDIQSYTVSDQNMPYYNGTLNWIASHSDRIKFVVQTGDVTDHNYISEWQRFYAATENFTNTMPVYTCIGNHDYLVGDYMSGGVWNQRDSTKFNEYVGFQSTASHIVAFFEPSKYENILIEEELFDNDPVYLLMLELEPRRGVVRWADSIVHAMPDASIVLVLHSFVKWTGVRYSSLQYMTDNESCTAQVVWDSLVYSNDNIRCVLCGHTDLLSQVLYSENSTGRIVPQIEFNIQYLPNGGDGYIQLWEFDRNNNVFVRTFNTHTETYINDSITEFQFKFK